MSVYISSFKLSIFCRNYKCQKINEIECFEVKFVISISAFHKFAGPNYTRIMDPFQNPMHELNNIYFYIHVIVIMYRNNLLIG